jgi:hypothetical protein
MNDHDIATMVRSATVDPEPGELELVRQRILDDVAGLRAIDTGRRRGVRPLVRPALLVAAVAALLAGGVGAMVSWRGDTGAPATTPAPVTPPTTVPVAVPVPSTAPPTTPASVIDGVEGTWMLGTVDGVPWSGPSVPLLRVESAVLVGWDGCNGGSWSTPTADGLGPAATSLVQCAGEFPEIFGATDLEHDGSSLRLDGPAGSFEFVPLGAAAVPAADDLVGTWAIGDSTVVLTIDPVSGRLVIDVGTCGFALDIDGAVLSPVVDPGASTSCGSPAVVGLTRALSDSERKLAAAVLDETLYLTVGTDPASPEEAYSLVRVDDALPDEPSIDGVALERGEVFGLGPDWSGGTVPPEQSADEALTVVAGALGAVGVDTGWYELGLTATDGDPDCLAGAEYRVLWWGDLSISFRRLDGVELLWTWSVGDPSASGFGDRGEPTATGTGPATGLVTEAGIGVGSTLDDLSAAYPGRLIDTGNLDGGGSVLYVSAGGQWPALTNSSIGFTVSDGLVTGYATTLSLC